MPPLAVSRRRGQAFAIGTDGDIAAHDRVGRDGRRFVNRGADAPMGDQHGQSVAGDE